MRSQQTIKATPADKIANNLSKAQAEAVKNCEKELGLMSLAQLWKVPNLDETGCRE
ncbi:MAG: hypothetical protein V7L01_17430 [Nostoc sp.]|uniref:hypothetical protein n=1 Tax=Nostoc sp. TaxID=1180 RepID=UPI002FF799E3